MVDSPVQISLDSTLVRVEDAVFLAQMYLPDDDIGNRWALDHFTWLPADSDLAALPWPLLPDSDATEPPLVDNSGGPTAYFAQVVLAGIPEEINPGAEGQGFIGGTLTGVEFRVSDKTISVDLAIARRIPRAQFSTPQVAVSYADVAANFPTVDYDDVDPSMSYYDVRLAHP